MTISRDNKNTNSYVMALNIKTSGKNIIKDHILNIAISIQDSESKEIKWFSVDLSSVNDEETIRKKMQSFVDFITQAEKEYTSLQLISQDSSTIISWLNYYFEKYKVRAPLSYCLDSFYRLIWDITTMQNIVDQIKKDWIFESAYSQDRDSSPLSLKEARITADLFNQLIKVLRKTHQTPSNVTKQLNDIIKLPEIASKDILSSKKKYLLAFHVHASGRHYMENGLLGIGAVVQDSDFEVIEKFKINIQLEPNQKFEKRSVDGYWSKHEKELVFLKQDATKPELAIKEFIKFVDKMEEQYDPEFICDNASYDIAWINFYIAKYTDKNPIDVTTKGEKRHIWDKYSQQKILLEASGDRETPWMDFSNIFDTMKTEKKEEHIALNDALRIVNFFNQSKKKCNLIKKILVKEAILELKQNQKQILSWINDITPLSTPLAQDDYYKTITGIISSYLFICDHTSNHFHELQCNHNFFTLLKHIEKLTDNIYLILNGIKSPFFNLVLGGGLSLSRSFDLTHRIHEDSDFEIVRNKKPLHEKNETDELHSFKQEIKNTLSKLKEFTLSEGPSYTWPEKLFFTFNLSFSYNLQNDFIKPNIELGFVYIPSNFHLPMRIDLAVLRYEKLKQKRIFTADIIDILAGKLISFVTDDGIFPRSTIINKKNPSMKNFFDVYILKLIFLNKKNELFEGMRKNIDVTRMTTRDYYTEFYQNPLKEISILLSWMISERDNQLSEKSMLAEYYNIFLETKVYSCKTHTFTETVDLIICIFLEFLRYMNTTFWKNSTPIIMKDCGSKLHSGEVVNLGSFTKLFAIKKQNRQFFQVNFDQDASNSIQDEKLKFTS